MNAHLSEECKRRLIDLEGKLVWSISVSENSEYQFILLRDFTTFLALTCRFGAQKIDEDCKEKMLEYERDIIDLRMQSTTKQISGLKAILTRVQRALE